MTGGGDGEVGHEHERGREYAGRVGDKSSDELRARFEVGTVLRRVFCKVCGEQVDEWSERRDK